MNQDNYSNNETIFLTEKTRYYFIVWRDVLTNKIDTLTKTEWQILKWISEKHSLNTICDMMSAHGDPESMPVLLPNLISRGYLLNQ